MSDLVVAVDGGSPSGPEPMVVAQPPPVPDALAIFASHMAQHEEHERRHEEHLATVSAVNERLAVLEERVGVLEATEHSSPSQEAREEALEELATVGEVVADVTGAVSGPEEVSVQTPPSTIRSTPDDGGAETIVTPDDGANEAGDGRGELESPTRPVQRKRSFW